MTAGWLPCCCPPQGDVYKFLKQQGGTEQRLAEEVVVPLVLEPFMQALQYIHSKVGWQHWLGSAGGVAAWAAGCCTRCACQAPLLAADLMSGDHPWPRASCTATSSRRTSC